MNAMLKARRKYTREERADVVGDLRAVEWAARKAGNFDGAVRLQELADAFALEPIAATRIVVADQACDRALAR